MLQVRRRPSPLSGQSLAAPRPAGPRPRASGRSDRSDWTDPSYGDAGVYQEPAYDRFGVMPSPKYPNPPRRSGWLEPEYGDARIWS